MRTTARIFVIATLLISAPAASEAALEVVVDTGGSGSQTYNDADLDGVVDFNETIGTVLEARGRVKQVIEGINSKLAIAPLPFE